MLIARLRPGAHGRAEELAAEALDEQGAAAALRCSIFLSPSEVVFLIEGDDARLQTRDWLNDPVLSTSIGSWLPLFDGPLHAAPEVAALQIAES